MFARDRQTAPWVEQWARVDRWLNKLEAAYGANTQADEMMDLFYAFFQNLFSMRDWLLRSPGMDRSKVEVLFSSHKLRLCRDIVNGSKHCVINKASVDPRVLTVREYDPYVRSEVFRVIANGHKTDLYGLAMTSLAEVQGFVIREGLWGATSSVTFEEFCFGPE